MITTRQQLRDIIDIVDSGELDILYRLLIKFIPEAEAEADEIEAMQLGREEIGRGEIVRHDEIDWS